MKIKRKKYSLKGCNPSEKKIRKEVNELDFNVKFPYFSFDKNKVDLHLLRRFLYQNKIPAYFLYTEEQIEKQLKERNISEEILFVEEEAIENRFEILDL